MSWGINPKFSPLNLFKFKYLYEKVGGETGIRTLGGRKPTTVFETAPFDRSGTSPRRWSSWERHVDQALRCCKP